MMPPRLYRAMIKQLWCDLVDWLNHILIGPTCKHGRDKDFCFLCREERGQ